MSNGPGFAVKCARKACNNPGTHQHRDNKQFYCVVCARGINAFALRDHNVDLFPSLKEKPVEKSAKQEHRIRMKAPTVPLGDCVIYGCSCGWVVPEGVDSDDAIAMHVATRGLVDLETLGPPMPGLYRHYKGGLYTVLGMATLEATLEPAVVYVNASTGAWWVRSLADFRAIVEHNGTHQPRFTRLG